MKSVKKFLVLILAVITMLQAFSLNFIVVQASNKEEVTLQQDQEDINDNSMQIMSQQNESSPIYETKTISGKTLQDGVYAIRTALNTNYVIDVINASMDNFANIQLYQDANVNQQKFNVKYIGDGYYNITALHSNKALDVANGGMVAGTNIWQIEVNNTDAQSWIIKSSGDGYYYVISKKNGLYLDVAGDVAKNNANIQVNTQNGSKAQKFKFDIVNSQSTPQIDNTERGKTIQDGVYTIRTALNTNYVIDVINASMDNFANIQLYQDANVNQQKFNVKYIGDGYYNITALHSNKALDVANGGMVAGTNIWQIEVNNTDAQSWIIKSSGDGYYYVISKKNGLYLDVAGNVAKNNANIQVNTQNGSKAQKFKFDIVNAQSKPQIDDTERGKTIQDGLYAIKSSLDTDYVFDVTSASMDNYANIQLYKNVRENQQKFTVKYIGDGYYNIIAFHSNKALDVANGGMVAGTNVWQIEVNNTDAQSWIIKSSGDGYYYVISKKNGLYLDVAGNVAKNNANIQVNTQNGSKAQKFKFELIQPMQGSKTLTEGIYSIETAISSNYVLGVAGGSKEQCANIQIYKKQASTKQRFKVSYVGDGYYTITAVNSNRLLDVANGGKLPGTNVWQVASNDTDAQKWIIKDAGNGYYNIISKLNELYLDVYGGIAQNGQNIQVNTMTGSNSQKFKFVEPYDILKSIDTSKYPGYKEKIADLMSKHPNWNFELLYTGLKFENVISGEASLHSRNLVPSNYGGEWICPVCGTKLYDSGWYCASEKATAYYMDPRNFLDENNIFQFQDLNEYIEGVCSLQGIQNQVNGTFLQNYASAIDNACRNQNVNAYYIITRVIQEQGRNGTTIGKGMDGGDGKTYYNPFDIGASGNGYDQIYANALARAKREGWDTMQKALEGGIVFCKNNWLENYQNTLYQNKFDIDTRNGSSLYTHQYMQNLMAAYSEASLLRGMYANTGKIDSNFTFIIPMYENMSQVISQMPTNKSESSIINVQITANGGLWLRKEASTSSDTLRLIPQGEVVLSVQRGINSNWHKVILTDGTIGYMSGTYLKQVSDVTNCNYTARVKTNDGSGCYVRMGPSLNLDRITALVEGTTVTVINEGTYNNIDGYNWVRIRIPDGRQAFMPSKYLAR